MARPLASVLGFVAALLVMAGMWGWFAFTPPPPPAPRTTLSKSAGQNLRVLLVRIDGPEDRRRTAADLWKNMFREAFADPESRALLSRLYGGTSVDALAVPSLADEPPPAVGETRLRVAAEPSGEERWDAVAARLGGRVDPPVECLLGTLDFVRTTALAADPAAAVSPPDDARDLAVLLLVVDDYLLRTQAGRRLVSGLGATPDGLRALVTDPVELRRELDHALAEYGRGR